jgi:16S rRNA (cytosine967-C5)-methyltransferase
MQRELLAAAACCVKPGGRLVYSTCSLEHDENQANVQWFLANHAGFQVDKPRVAEPLLTEDRTALCCLPMVHGTDGSFAAAFVRQHRH